MLKTDSLKKPTFVMPERLEVEEESLTGNFGRFNLQPLERGFGTTLGSGLRRTLLSSMEGAAIQAIRIEGVQHEFSTVTGVVEDVPEIILNLKEVRLLLHSEDAKTIHVSKAGPGVLTADDLEVDSDVVIVNKDHVIASLDEGAELTMELEIGHGRGFVLADEMVSEDTPLGTIAIDAAYSPIEKVNFHVQNARVGQRTDYDKLVLEVWTDGTVTPTVAVGNAARLLRNHLQLFLGEGEIDEEIVAVQQQKTQTSVLDMKVDDLELSMRSINCLRAAGITSVEELVLKSENDMLKYRNFGRKSLIELTEKLENLGVSFGMTPEDVEEVRAKGLSAPESDNDDKEDTQ